MRIAYTLTLTALLIAGTFGCKKTETTVTLVTPVVPTPVVETMPKTAANDEGFLFYNASTGASAFYEVGVNFKSLNLVKDYGTRLGTNWTTVMSYQGFLLLYNANTGEAALFDGLKITKRFSGFGYGFTHLTNIGNGRLVCYDALTGKTLYRVYDGSAETFITLANVAVAAGYTSVLMGAPGVATGYVLWYNKTTGNMTMGYFNSNNTYANQATAKFNAGCLLYNHYFSYRFWYTPTTGQGGTVNAGVLLDKATITAPAANFPAKAWKLIESSENYVVTYGSTGSYAIYATGKGSGINGSGTFQGVGIGTNILKTDWTHLTSIQF
ncbi:hypothetical protein [Fibrella arboris]|uniref:hypothetical protein n=1 Tax=Fibrella arboris TaxID=3242486 RepID=UPI003521F727